MNRSRVEASSRANVTRWAQIRSRFFFCTVIRPTLVSERWPEQMKKCIFRHRPRKYGTFSQKLKFLKCILHCFPQQHKTYEREFSFFLRFFPAVHCSEFFPTWDIKVVLNYLSFSPSAPLSFAALRDAPERGQPSYTKVTPKIITC